MWVFPSAIRTPQTFLYGVQQGGGALRIGPNQYNWQEDKGTSVEHVAAAQANVVREQFR